MSEKAIENEILHWLNTRTWCFAWKNNSTGIFDPVAGRFRKSNNRFAINGVPDILGVLEGGGFLGIEVKSPERKNNLSQSQKAFQAKSTKLKGLVFSASSLLEVQETLQKGNSKWI